MNFSLTEQQLHTKFNDAKNYAEQVRQRNEPSLPETPQVMVQNAGHACPGCQTQLSASDAFCGNCGLAQQAEK